MMANGPVDGPPSRVLCRVLDQPGLLADKRFATPTARSAGRQEMYTILVKIFATASCSVYAERLRIAARCCR